MFSSSPRSQSFRLIVSSYNMLIRVTSWVMHFIRKPNCQDPALKAPLTVQELLNAETYWLSIAQSQCFSSELESLNSKNALPSNSALLPLQPFIDLQGILRVGGRKQESKLAYSRMYPIILDGKYQQTRQIIQTEHSRLLHAGPTLLMSSLNCRYHTIGDRRVVCSITRACVICRRKSQKPNPQLMGQLPIELVTPDIVFKNVGVDYTGPIYIKQPCL